MMVAIRLFAAAKQIAGKDSVAVEIPQAGTVGDLRRELIRTVPALEPMVRHAMFAVDREYAQDETAVPADAEVACIPPVSGG